jgi:Na+-translocating ferredoxin:NAD+ oxidoreductase RnfD subunit
LICAICSPLFEMLWCWLIKRPDSTDDLSAVVTGVLLAYNLPVSTQSGRPWRAASLPLL